MKYAYLRLILLMSFVILDVHISAASNISGDTVIIDGDNIFESLTSMLQSVVAKKAKKK